MSVLESKTPKTPIPLYHDLQGISSHADYESQPALSESFSDLSSLPASRTDPARAKLSRGNPFLQLGNMRTKFQRNLAVPGSRADENLSPAAVPLRKSGEDSSWAAPVAIADPFAHDSSKDGNIRTSRNPYPHGTNHPDDGVEREGVVPDFEPQARIGNPQNLQPNHQEARRTTRLLLGTAQTQAMDAGLSFDTPNNNLSTENSDSRVERQGKAVNNMPVLNSAGM